MRISGRRASSILCLAACLVAGLSCGSDDDSGSDSTVGETLAVVSTTSTSTTSASTTSILPPVTETTVSAATTTAAPSTTAIAVAPTTAAAPSTAVAATTTSSTDPVGASLSLDDDGIGAAVFGDDPDLVVEQLRAVLGEPSDDSGWVDAVTRTCPGTQVRFVRWTDLTLVFGDESSVASGRRHFFAWSFGPPAEVGEEPAGLATSAGVGLGSTVAEVGRAYPDASLFAGDELATASIQINDNLFAFVTSTDESGAVTAMLGGQGCGE